MARRTIRNRNLVNLTTWDAEEGSIGEGEPREWAGKNL
jgi:hypothetical protein